MLVDLKCKLSETFKLKGEQFEICQTNNGTFCAKSLNLQKFINGQSIANKIIFWRNETGKSFVEPFFK